jgi:signal transduction histidine kinase
MLGARHAWVSEILECGERARTLAYWADGRFIEPFEYALKNTPCETVVTGDIVQISEKLTQRYPQNERIARLRVESYIGIPLVSRDGEVLGHVAATDREAMGEKTRDFSTFKVFASRATAELERRRADAALARVRSKLVQSEKLASLGKLTAGVAHEVNSPVGVIQSNLDLSRSALRKIRRILDDGGTTPAAEKCLGVIEEALDSSAHAGRRISDIVESLKRFTRVDAAEYQQTDVEEGLDATLALLQAHVPAGVSVEKHYGGVPPIQSHPAELNQVFMTLLQNAVDAVGDDGCVTVTTAADDREMQIRIADDGPGIPPEQMNELFDIGFSSKGARVGMRIGLPIAHHIIKSHGGDIKVSANDDGGTVFAVVLPRS